MTEDRDVSSQIHDYHLLINDLAIEDIKLPEPFVAGYLVETLPESWKDYKNNMKHKRKQMSLEDVIIHIRIEEQNRNRDNIEKAKELSSKANVVEEKPKPKNNRSRKQNSRTKPNASNKVQNSTIKKRGNCFVCGKSGHHAAQCRHRKRTENTNSKENLAETEVITAVISSEVSMVTNMMDWVVDSGATRHICGNGSAFTSYTTVKEGEEQVFMGDSRSTPVIGKGKVLLKLTSGKVLALCDVLHVPDIRWNLVSVSLLGKAGVRILFDSDKIVLTKNDAFVGKGYCNQGLFLLNVSDIINNNASSSSAYIVDSCDIWHGRLGHVNFSYMKRMVELSLIPKLSLENHEKYESCVESKTTKKSCKSVERGSNLLSLIHSDLGDLKNTMTRGGKRFYITFIDDYSRYTRVYLLRNKDEAKDAFIKYKIEVENQLSKKIKRLRTDRGGEYESNPFNSFCEDHGIIHETTPPYSPESNGVAERKNRTLKDMMNAMLVSSGAPLNLWGEAILSACHIQNRIPYKKTSKTLYELWKGYAPNIAYLKVWGCLAKVLLPESKKRKLGPKTFDAMFIGYAKNSVAYRFLVTKSENNLVDVNTIVETKNADFFENIFPMKLNGEQEVQKTRRDKSIEPSEFETRRSKRDRKETNLGDGFYTFLIDEDPRSYKEAITSPDAPFWKEAINSEIESIMYNHTWELVDLPPGAKTIGCKWIFKRKLKQDGSIEKYKARLVAKGFKQRKDVDYFDTFAPMTRIASIRVLIALASIHNLVVHQMDVKTAFLNGDLEEEIYMDQPESCVVPGKEKKVCKLVKSLYGLKQAPKQWHNKFDHVLVTNGYSINDADKCIYSKYEDNTCVVICLYVDDMLIFGTNLEVVCETKKFLGSKFDMKDLGEAEVILGIKIIRTPNGLKLSQEHYVEKILRKFEHFDCKPVSTPYDPSLQLKKNRELSVAQIEYAQILGSLMYLMNYTRPDIAYAVGRLSRYTQSPNQDHWTAIRRVLKYLRGTINYGLCFSGFPSVLEGFSDANWISDSDEMKSTSGYVFILGGSAVSWRSAKQTCITRSTMEAEFIALEKASSEAEWLRNLLADIPLWTRPAPSVSMRCDSQAAIAKAKSKIFNGKNRHIRLRHNIVRQLLETGVISLEFVRSELNLADPLTKPLNKKLVEETSRGMGLMPTTEVKSCGNPTY
ncbi:hypothetical protein PVL29_016537 [Vitis rotundifolia]|uniref:Retrovirus-related Pol polyprotein from transposon TNT 1-94 n=1 Tax=Vitis rotundifolia TaxID=103349 RepID=A0AA38Z7Z9_VITRO|nr:hypothetical protein PVL29_016537 [Vitis rotundifolia]